MAILATVDGSVPLFDCRAHSATMNGVKAKIMNGIERLEPGRRNLPVQKPRIEARSVKSSAHSAMVLPCCS